MTLNTPLKQEKGICDAQNHTVVLPGTHEELKEFPHLEVIKQRSNREALGILVAAALATTAALAASFGVEAQTQPQQQQQKEDDGALYNGHLTRMNFWFEIPFHDGPNFVDRLAISGTLRHTTWNSGFEGNVNAGIGVFESTNFSAAISGGGFLQNCSSNPGNMANICSANTTTPNAKQKPVTIGGGTVNAMAVGGFGPLNINAYAAMLMNNPQNVSLLGAAKLALRLLGENDNGFGITVQGQMRDEVLTTGLGINYQGVGGKCGKNGRMFGVQAALTGNLISVIGSEHYDFMTILSVGVTSELRECESANPLKTY